MSKVPVLPTLSISSATAYVVATKARQFGANIGLHRDSLCMKSPLFAGLSAPKK